MVHIRKFKAKYFKACVALMRQSVRISAIHHYDSDQIKAWVGDGLNQSKLMDKLIRSNGYIIFDGSTIIAFGNAFQYGYIDCLYVDPFYQSFGVGSRLLSLLESTIIDGHAIMVDASDNAFSFFYNHGYRFLKRNIIQRGDTTLCNTTLVKTK